MKVTVTPIQTINVKTNEKNQQVVQSTSQFVGASASQAEINHALAIAQAASTTANTALVVAEGAQANVHGDRLINSANAQAVLDSANNFTVPGNLIFSDTTTQTTAFTGSAIDQTARNIANSASSNTINLQGGLNTANANIALIFGIDATQNTNITNATNLAQAAYNTANATGSSAFVQYAANTANSASANTISLQGGLNSANANITSIFAIDATQNTWIASNAAFTQSAFTVANSASANTIVTQGVDLYQNTQIAIVQGGLNTANANISLLFAIDNVQNNNITIVQGGLNSANANIVAVQALANTDYTTLTASAGVYGNSAYVPVITLAANGRVTSIVNTLITITGSSYSNTNVSSYLLSNVFNISANVITANAIYSNGVAVLTSEPIGSSASANTIVTQGVDAYQNNLISIVQGGLNTANANISLIFGINSTQNTWIASNSVYSQAAFGVANSAQANTIVTQGVDLYQNNLISIVQGGLNTANANIALLFVIDNAQNTSIANANNLAQAAFDRANTKFNSSGGTISGPVTIQSDLTVTGNVNFTGNVTSIQVTGNTGQFFGYASNGFNALYAGIPTGYFLEPQTVFQISSNFNGYSGLNMQNINSGANSSSDLFITSDNGTVNDGFLDLGMGSSNYNYPGYNLIGKNDGYLFTTGNTTTGGGNMIVGTGLPNDIIFAVNGLNTNNEVARFKYNTGLLLKQPITFADSTSQNTAAAPFAYSNASFAQANSASSNTVSLQNVNLTQNTWIASNAVFSQAAFNVANSASSNTIITQGVDLYQNNLISIVQGGLNSANANIVAVQALANTDYTNITTTAGVYGNSTFVPVITLAANGRIISITNTAITTTGGGGGGSGNANTTGWLPNAVIYSNSAGYLSNTNTLQFYSSNNTLIVPNLTLSQGAGGTITFPDGTTQATAATGAATDQTARNSAAAAQNTANYAANTANSAQANTIVTQGVDLYQNNLISIVQGGLNSANANIALILGIDATQNTWIASNSVFSQAAFNTANSASSNTIVTQGVDAYQNNQINILQGGLNTANANISLLFNIDNYQNTQVSIVQGGLNTANANITLIFGIDATQNTWIASNAIFSQAAFNTANSAQANTIVTQGVDAYQNTQINILQGGLNTANANIAYILGVDITQNNNIAIVQGGLNTANANIIALQTLANTDYTTLTAAAGVYGNSTYVPVITLAANGRVLSIVNTAITVTGTGSGGNTNSFSTIIVSGQPTLYANTPTSPLTLVAGANVTITTNQTTNTITISATGGSGGGGSGTGNANTTGWLANSVIFANSAGYLSNASSLQFSSTTNTLKVNGSVVIANTLTTNSASMIYNATFNSIDFYFS